MASISMTGRGDAEEVAKRLLNAIQNSAMSCKLIEDISRQFGETYYNLMVFDKFYMRTSSRASLTVTVIGHDDHVFVDAVGSGGGLGVLFRFSWGAERNFVEKVYQFLFAMGFREEVL